MTSPTTSKTEEIEKIIDMMFHHQISVYDILSTLLSREPACYTPIAIRELAAHFNVVCR